MLQVSTLLALTNILTQSSLQSPNTCKLGLTMVTWTKNRQTSATRNSFEDDDDDDEEAEAVVERVRMCVCVPHQSESLQFGNFLFQIELR